jgi:hypothetical protein
MLLYELTLMYQNLLLACEDQKYFEKQNPAVFLCSHYELSFTALSFPY